MSPRSGRPKSENPLSHIIKVRIDENTNNYINEYCERHEITRTEFLRQAIELILAKENQNK